MFKLKPFAKEGNIELLVHTGETWFEPALYIKEENKEPLAITANSGEHENDLEEFFLMRPYLSDSEFALVNKVLPKVSIEESFEENYAGLPWTKFVLNEEYANKLKELCDL